MDGRVIDSPDAPVPNAVWHSRHMGHSRSNLPLEDSLISLKYVCTPTVKYECLAELREHRLLSTIYMFLQQ